MALLFVKMGVPINFLAFYIECRKKPQVFSLLDVRHYPWFLILNHISAGTVDYTGGEGVRTNLLKGRSSAKPEAHESVARG